MKSIFRISAALFILALAVSSCSAQVLNVKDLKSSKIGVLSGSISEELAESIVSGDKNGIVIHYGTISEIIEALRSRDIDAAVMDESPARYFAIGSKEFKIIPEPVESEYYAIAFKKGNALRDEVDKALDAVIAEKTLAEIIAKYLDDEPDPLEIDFNEGAKGGKLWVGCAASFPPYGMRTSEGFSGIDVELCAALAKKLDKELVIVDYRFDMLPEALETGRIDMICSAFSITEERMKTMDFSKPYDANQEVIVVLSDAK